MTSYTKYIVFLLMGLLFGHQSLAQRSIFDDPKLVEEIRKGADFLYGYQRDSARHYIELIKSQVPDHPIVPMMEGVSILWYNIPVLEGEVFDRFDEWMNMTVTYAQNLPEGHPDRIFFEMSSRGLLAEYYADRGNYMKALNEATQAYGLLKEGFELASDYPEFLFAVGLYNYFREAYPEKHPFYKPLVWFFKGGDKEEGIAQLERATQDAIIIKVEAFVYLSYIYLRYEEDAESSKQYITELFSQYPANPYVMAKYLESHYSAGDLDKISPDIIAALKAVDREYYQLVAFLYEGIRREKIDRNQYGALESYQKAGESADKLSGFGDYYKSLLYLGLGRVNYERGQKETADRYFYLAIDHAQTEDVKTEAFNWLDK